MTRLLNIFLTLFALSGTIANIGSASAVEPALGKSVVKIYSAIQRPDYSMPWQGHRPQRANGSGFIIAGKRILTNAHVVSDTRFLLVQKHGDPKRYLAEVLFAGHDCDLAVLEVRDDAFFNGTKPLKFDKNVPDLNDEVLVIGFPMGGDRLSVTRGIVSRIDYSIYSHSGIDQHLVVQVDAAINPGNSGGPVVYKGKVVGLAFQSMAWAENIGYTIPVPVINRFLKDIKDETYDGYPELGIGYINTRNPALRNHLGLSDSQTGVLVHYVDPFGSARGIIEQGDVLTSIEGHDINNEGRIEIDGNQINFFEILERQQKGESAKLRIFRNGKSRSRSLTLNGAPDPYTFRNLYDRQPEYVMYAGLVFTPLTRNYVGKVTSGSLNAREQRILYYMANAKIDKLYKDRQKFIVLSHRLAHPVNTYTESFVEGIVSSINGTEILGLEDVNKALKKPSDGFHIVKFAGMHDFLVLDAKEADKATDIIAAKYGVQPLQNIIHEEKK